MAVCSDLMQTLGHSVLMLTLVLCTTQQAMAITAIMIMKAPAATRPATRAVLSDPLSSSPLPEPTKMSCQYQCLKTYVT